MKKQGGKSASVKMSGLYIYIPETLKHSAAQASVADLLNTGINK